MGAGLASRGQKQEDSAKERIRPSITPTEIRPSITPTEIWPVAPAFCVIRSESPGTRERHARFRLGRDWYAKFADKRESPFLR